MWSAVTRYVVPERIGVSESSRIVSSLGGARRVGLGAAFGFSRDSSALTLGNFRRGSVTVSAAGLAGGLVVGPATRREAPPSSCQCAPEEP